MFTFDFGNKTRAIKIMKLCYFENIRFNMKLNF